MRLANLLIVEDDEEWRNAYWRTAAKSGVFRVKTAEDLVSARALVDEMQFAVAFIDIGLSVYDDQNVDGLLVMEKIRSVDAETSIVVVTGRSGRDVMPITRAALKRFKAFDIVAKSGTEPAEIRRLLLSGLEEYEKCLAGRPNGCDALRGGVEQMFWDDEMLRAARVKGGAPALYSFVERLLSSALPVVPGQPGDSIRPDPATGLVHGAFWSRAFGQAIVVCFGPEAKCRGQIAEAETGGTLLDRYPVADVLEEHAAHGLSGAIFQLRDASRAQFATTFA